MQSWGRWNIPRLRVSALAESAARLFLPCCLCLHPIVRKVPFSSLPYLLCRSFSVQYYQLSARRLLCSPCAVAFVPLFLPVLTFCVLLFEQKLHAYGADCRPRCPQKVRGFVRTTRGIRIIRTTLLCSRTHSGLAAGREDYCPASGLFLWVLCCECLQQSITDRADLPTFGA